jgi:alkyldihydroxyacetonephosphate synthase
VKPTEHLAELLGPHRVSTDPIDLARHAHDQAAGSLLAERRGDKPDLPICVVRPRTTDQVRSVVAWANSSKTPIVPYGGGSGVCGAVAAGGTVVVDLRAMDEILDFDEKSRLVRVQPGMLGPDLAKALRSWGYMLGHEPQSVRISTVGGWIATRAAGQLSARYGGIEDILVALEAVLPTGQVVRSKMTPRRSAGPDIASLLVGAEGSLGIVIAQSELRPTLVRLYDHEDSTIFLRHHPDETPGPLLLLSFDGPGCAERADAAVELSGGTPGDDTLVAHWWEHRNDAVDEYRNLLRGEGLLGPHGVVDTVEVSGSWTVLRDLYHSMKKSLEGHADLVGCHLSHVYEDGACLYFTLASASPDEATAVATLEGWWDRAMRACLDSGGSISHHHGVGRVKARWLEEELGGWRDALVAVKKALDPNGIMNPGVLGL